MILRSRRILGTAHGGVLDGWVRIDGGLIVEVGAGSPSGDAHELAGWLAPGFVDIHVHGGGGAAFQDDAPDAAAVAAAFHRAHGTTTLLASLVSAPLDSLVAALRRLEEARAAGLVAGVHLEGPFLAAPRRGAHDAAVLASPSPEALDVLLASDAVRMVTLAPELPGGLDAVRRIVANGAVAAVGHTTATYEQTVAAIDAGARVATHLFNGMPPALHRDPGPVLALVEDPRVTVELINDGVHLHDRVFAATAGAVGSGRVALVTDAIAATGLPDGDYELGSQRIVVAGGVSTLAGGGSLAGSVLTMDRALARSVRLGMSPVDAVACATATPAAAAGLDDVGRIEPGLRANLVALDDDFAVTRVWVDGAGQDTLQEMLQDREDR